jgi:hypothetical protein
MRRYRALGVAAFVVLLVTIGCNGTPVAPQPVPGPVVQAPPVQAPSPPVEVIVSKREVVGHVASSGATLKFESLDSNFSLIFSLDANHPPACQNVNPGTTINVCGSYSCTINPVAATKRVFYMIGPQTGYCPVLAPPPPIPFSVVHCKSC